MWDDRLDGKTLTISRPVITYMLKGSLFFGSRVRLEPQWIESLEQRS